MLDVAVEDCGSKNFCCRTCRSSFLSLFFFWGGGELNVLSIQMSLKRDGVSHRLFLVQW